MVYKNCEIFVLRISSKNLAIEYSKDRSTATELESHFRQNTLLVSQAITAAESFYHTHPEKRPTGLRLTSTDQAHNKICSGRAEAPNAMSPALMTASHSVLACQQLLRWSSNIQIQNQTSRIPLLDRSQMASSDHA